MLHLRFHPCPHFASRYAGADGQNRPLVTLSNLIWLKKSKLVHTNRFKTENKLETEPVCADILSWIAADETLMSRFLALSGLTADTLRQASTEPGFYSGILAFLMGHEPTLIAYCEDRDIAPEHLVEVWQKLEHGPQTDTIP